MGRACGESILRLKKGYSWQESGKKGKWAAGNGGAMRVAPVGLLNFKNDEQLKIDAKLTTLITHNNNEAIAGSIAISFGISLILNNNIVKIK